MLNFVSLSGKKEVKVYDKPEVLLTSTKGDIRLTPQIQELLGVKDGDYLATVSLTDENGNIVPDSVYIAKGIAGIPLKDENGELVRSKNNHIQIEEGSSYGSVLRIASEGSPLLRTSAAVAWNNAGGDETKIKRFTLGEGQEGKVPTGAKDADGNPILHTATFYKLIFSSESKKMARKTKDSVETTEGETISTPEGNAESIEEVEDDFNEDEFENEEV